MLFLRLNIQRCSLLATLVILSACGSDDTDDSNTMTMNEAGSESTIPRFQAFLHHVVQVER